MERRAKGRASAPVLCLAAVVSLGLVALAGVGCTHPPEGLPVVKGLEQDDIPVKPGFEFVDSETYDPPVRDIGKFRSWKGWYEGKGTIEDIGPWYVQAMSEQGWEFTGRSETAGPVFAYTFCKGEETALIEVQQIYKSMLGGPAKQVRAEIHPRGSESFTPEQIVEFEAADRAAGVSGGPIDAPGTIEGAETTPTVGSDDDLEPIPTIEPGS